ncbi:MAG TPA: DUF1573 domain-containing protein [Planctomycetota bacterium]|nr:DUF1573 domain-containing protein [Planctomycetota bacterium]
MCLASTRNSCNSWFFRLLVVLALLLTRPALAGEAPVPATATAAPAPRIALPEREWNFGQAVAGVAVDHVFKFRNAGTADLVVKRVRPSCVCTAALLSKSTLAPGEEGAISVHFDTGDKIGYHDIQIQVLTNDDLEKDLGDGVSLLHLRGQVENLLSVLPTAIYYSSPFLRGSPSERRATVLPTDVAEVSAVSVTATNPYLRVTAVPYRQGGRRGFEIVATLAPDVPLGRLEGHVIVRTDHPRQPLLRVPLFGVVNGTFAQYPERLQLYPHDGKDATIAFMRLAGEGPVPVESMEAPPFLEVSPAEPISRGAEFTVKVKPGAPPGPFAGVIRVFLRDREQPMFEIPVTGEVMRKVVVDPPAVWLEGQGASATLRLHGARAKRVGIDADADRSFAISGGDGEVVVKLLPGATPGPIRGKLTITTDVPGEETIEVPIRGQVPPDR